MEYALINAGAVVNRIVADADFVALIADQYQHVEQLPEGSPVGIGWAWSVDGGFIAPAAPEVPVIPVPAVPVSVSMRQAKRALLAAGLLDLADQAIAGIADDTERRAAQIDWTSATDVRRDWPLVASIAQALGLTDQQIDALFVAASQL